MAYLAQNCWMDHWPGVPWVHLLCLQKDQYWDHLDQFVVLHVFGQAASKAGKLGSHFWCNFSNDKLFASMRNSEALDKICQTDMTSCE